MIIIIKYTNRNYSSQKALTKWQVSSSMVSKTHSSKKKTTLYEYRTKIYGTNIKVLKNYQSIIGAEKMKCEFLCVIYPSYRVWFSKH